MEHHLGAAATTQLMHAGADAPWKLTPRLQGPAVLVRSEKGLDDLFDLPDGSAASLARIDPREASLCHADWKGTGRKGFYPASTIKWVTAFLCIERMAEQSLGLGHVLQVGDDPPRTFRDLLAGMVVMSDNPAFNVLQEWVGFAETYAKLQAWGCRNSLIRRHFTRPHWNHSRPARIWTPEGKERDVTPARPAVDLPLNTDPSPDSPRESNWFTCDDLLRCAASTLMGPYRDLPQFDALAGWLGYTNQCAVREGLWRVTASSPRRPGFTVLNKPGWWPADGANSELCYIYDAQSDNHYLLAIYVQGEHEPAQAAMAKAAEATFQAIRGDWSL